MKTVLILKADRLYAETLRQLVLSATPGADVRVPASIDEATRILATGVVRLVIAALDPMLGDVPGLLARCVREFQPAPRVLALASHDEDRVLAALRALPVDGVFDSAHDQPENFRVAVRRVIAAQGYWSPSVTQRLEVHHTARSSPALLLTTGQQIALSILGDGSDDRSAARALGLCISTVSTIRRQLHRKLGVQHRGELIRIAAQHGFVRFTSAGVVRPGFTLLTSAFHGRKTRRALQSAIAA